MHDPLRPLAAQVRPPANLPTLYRRINDYARANSLPAARVQQRVKTELIFALLERAREQGIIPMYVAKGGMAIELRFGVRARASGDVDVGIVADDADLLTLFDHVLALSLGDFTFARGQTQLLVNARAHRAEVRIAFRGRAFGTLRVDLNEANYETPVAYETTGVMTQLGLPGPLTVPLLDPYVQIAHKLHGATEPNRDGYVNHRYRDVLDVLIIAGDPSTKLDMAHLRTIVVEEFARRPHHKLWPPIFALPEDWRAELEREAREIGFHLQDAEAIAQAFIALIARIEGIDVNPEYEYELLSLDMSLVGGDPMPPHSRAALKDRTDRGARVVYIGPRQGYADQFLAVLERRRNAEIDALPRLQLRLRSEQMPNGTLSLKGVLRNENNNAANKTRVGVSAVNNIVRLGTVTHGDGPIEVAFRYDNEELRTMQVQFPAITVEYLNDRGQKVQQIGRLIASPADASGRYTYEGQGLDAPHMVEHFTLRHDTDEVL